MDVSLAAVRVALRVGVVVDHVPVVIDETPTTEELLVAWSNASLAAELARRLAGVGDTAEAATELDADAAPEVASLVESTVQDATEAAAIARGTGDRMQRAGEAEVAPAAHEETSARHG